MDYLATGVIRTSHGVKGYVKVHLFSGDSRHLEQVERVMLRKDGKELTAGIQDIQISGASLLVKFDCIESPEAGRRFAGWEIWIDRKNSPSLDPDEYYQADIIGCSVRFEKTVLGEVAAIVEGAQAPLMEISTASGSCLVPFMAHFVEKVDIEQRVVELTKNWIEE